MGIFRIAVFNGLLGTTVAASYLAVLAAKNPLLAPLPSNDPLFTSKVYTRHNPHGNPSNDDICIKRIPFGKIRPELLKSEGDLTLEFARGIWAGWGYKVQRKYLEMKWKGPETAHQLWTPDQLASSTYEQGTQVTDHFEVVEKTKDSITFRCGDSPRNPSLRATDGLVVVSAKLDKAREEVELRLKCCLFTSEGKQDRSKPGPMPPLIEELHQWYARIWSETGSWRLLK